MAIPLTGTGGLFTRIGLLLGNINVTNTFRGTTYPPRINSLQAQFQSADQSVIDGIYQQLTNLQGSLSGSQSAWQSLAQSTLIQMVADDAPQPNGGLLNAMTYLINQMVNTAQTVKQNTIGGSVTYGGSNVGNPVLTFSTLNQYGASLQYIFNETIKGVVTSDSINNGATAGKETILFSAPQTISPTLSWLWPGGSGANRSLTCVSALDQGLGGTANWITNGNFETFATLANVPDKWHVVAGVPGTTIFQDTGTYYDGLSSVRFAGTGTENTTIWQQFGVDTTPSPKQYNVLAFNTFIKLDVVPASGVLEFALVDGGGTVINDAAGNPNSISQSLTSIGTNWTSVQAYFRMPRVIPSQIYIRIRLTTPLSGGSSVYIDHMALATPIQLYTAGPYIVCFSGNLNLVNGDQMNLIPTNDYGGQFQNGFNRLFGMSQLGLQLPSSGSPTISDGLII